MINREVLEGNWNEIKGKLRQKWGQLTDDDVARFQGNVDELVGLIERKTGEGREAVERFLQDAVEGLGTAAETVRKAAHRAVQSVREPACQAAAHVHECISEVKCCVRDRPGKCLAICFGMGVVAGVLLTSSFHAR